MPAHCAPARTAPTVLLVPCCEQLKVPRPVREGGFFPRRRATVIDRGKDFEGVKTRGFANMPEMLAVLKK